VYRTGVCVPSFKPVAATAACSVRSGCQGTRKSLPRSVEIQDRGARKRRLGADSSYQLRHGPNARCLEPWRGRARGPLKRRPRIRMTSEMDAYATSMSDARITIDRASRGWFGSARSYRVLIDDRRVARVRYGEAVTVVTTPGRHELQLALDWARSPKLPLDVAESHELRLRCGPYGNPLVSIFRFIFTPRRAIVLEIDPRWGEA
jgi:hypothetical protein